VASEQAPDGTPPNDDDPLIAQRGSNNPYLQTARIILDRLAWDLRLQSWVSRSRLRAWRDRYRGGSAVILCNGPSLMKSDLGLLDGLFTVALNKINLLFDRSKFRPSCVVAVNQFVIAQNADFYRTTDLPLFLSSKGMRHVGARDNVIYLHSSPMRRFARDCSVSIYESHTVTFVALQLAFHMGFQRVALIGCDHTYSVKGPENKTVSARGKDPDHFDPNYFADGMKWHLPDLFESEVGYDMAHRMYRAHGRQLVNATEGGQLEIFARMSLADFVAQD
jgi:hypothetical protein